MKCKPNPALPYPAASTERPCAQAGESLAWSKTIPSENPWMDPAHGCRQRPEHSVGKAFFPFCGVERAEAWSMEKHGAKNPGGCLPAPGKGRQLSSAAERGRPHPHPNEHPLLLLPITRPPNPGVTFPSGPFPQRGSHSGHPLAYVPMASHWEAHQVPTATVINYQR